METTNGDSLFDLLSDEEVEQIDLAVQVVEGHEGEIRRIEGVFRDTDHKLTVLAARSRRNPINAAARALGEVPPLEENTGAVPPSESPAELREALEGLKMRRGDEEKSLDRARHALERLVSGLVRTAANRAAESYVRSAREVWRSWAILASAQRFAMDETGYRPGAVVQHVCPDAAWTKLCIPGSTEQSVPALAKASRAEWGMPVLFSGEDDRGAVANAHERLLNALRAHRAEPGRRKGVR